MPRLSLWNSGRKGNDYRFIDRQISEWFGVGGTAVYVHRYIGPHDQRAPNADGTPLSASDATENTIQDVLFLENRDRKYAHEVIELRGVYSVADNDFDLRQFGLFLTGDTLFIEFHMNDMLAMLGRKIMPGDVLELPHQRDDALLDPTAAAINRFYMVDDVSKSSVGYSPTWWPHIWRVKISPMTAGQETKDILEKQAQDPFGIDQGKIGDLMTMLAQDLKITEDIVEQARRSVSGRNFETRQFYVIPGDGGATGPQNPWIFAGDGSPPNGAIATGAGNRFPDTPAEGDYFLRTDYEPKALFQRQGSKWRMQELDYRQGDWSAAHRLLLGFINNNKSHIHSDGVEQAEKQPISRAIRPQADF